MIYAVTNQKGGVGKTTTAAAIWAGMNVRGRHVLAIDLDPQGNMSYSARAQQGAGTPTALGVLMGEALAIDAIQHTETGDLLPSAPGLNAADRLFSQTGREFLLRNALRKLAPRYDAIIIDTPPALGILTVNALTFADAALIPAQAEIYSIQGIREVAKAVQALRPDFNPRIKIAGIVLTRYNGRNTITQEAEALIANQAAGLGTRLFAARIREAVAVREAQINRKSLFDYAPRSKVTADYMALIDEIEEAEKADAVQ